MLNITMKGAIYDFDNEAFDKALKAALEREMRNAAKAFAKAALSKIPVRTGFVAGAFGALTELLGENARFNPIVSYVKKTIQTAKRLIGKGKPKAANNIIEYYYPGDGTRVLKTTASGRQFATPKEEMFKWEDNTFVFTFDVDISYFSLQEESTGRSPTAPWQAFESGRIAFEQYMANVDILKEIDIEDYIKTK